MRLQAAVMLCVAVSSACEMSRGPNLTLTLSPLPLTPGRPAMFEAPQILVDLANQCEGSDLSPWRLPWAMSVRVRGVAGHYRINRELRVAFWPRW